MGLLCAYVGAVGAWTIAANVGAAQGLPLRVGGVSVGDKVVHFCVVGLFSLVIARALSQSGVRAPRSLVYGGLLAATLATLEEFTNALTPHRCCSGWDLMADYAGIVTLSVAGLWTDLAPSRRRRHPTEGVSERARGVPAPA